MQVSLLLNEPGLKPELIEAFNFLKECNDRAAELTRQVLTFSRRQPIQKQAIQMNLLLADMLNLLRRLLGEQIEITLQFSAAEFWVEVDRGMIEQVVMNLCINARDAMAHGGILTLGLQMAERTEADTRCNADARPGRFVCLSVADQGCGMQEATLNRIFEPFFTTKSVGKGTGLGLAVIYGIAKQHNGWIEVSSELGKGTEFRVFLPASGTTELPPLAHSQKQIQRGTETILLVEDEPTVRLAVAKCLRHAGYQVLEAKNAPDAIEKWSGQIADIRLLLTDMVMPGGMNGWELAKEFKKVKPDLPVIITSGYNTEIVKSGIPTGRGLAYLPKPSTAEVITTTIRELLSEIPASLS
jgi:CheY-like chemotaxis protein